MVKKGREVEGEVIKMNILEVLRGLYIEVSACSTFSYIFRSSNLIIFLFLRSRSLLPGSNTYRYDESPYSNLT